MSEAIWSMFLLLTNISLHNRDRCCSCQKVCCDVLNAQHCFVDGVWHHSMQHRASSSCCTVVQVRAHLANLEKGQKQVCLVFEEWTSALNPGPVSQMPLCCDALVLLMIPNFYLTACCFDTMLDI